MFVSTDSFRPLLQTFSFFLSFEIAANAEKQKLLLTRGLGSQSSLPQKNAYSKTILI